MAAPLDLFLPEVAGWFAAAFGRPTRAQALGWPAIARGESTLLLAPTGSGKTLAAFLVAIDALLRRPAAAPSRVRPHTHTRVLYVSPLKALAVDVERNLRAPLAGIVEHAARGGVTLAAPTVDVRTGDTPAKDRARMARRPADVLITTPESLYLLLTSAAGRASLADVETVIVDEIHALVPSKRGAHLALSLERLEALRSPDARRLQRIGLSATQRPLDEVARFLGGFEGGRPRAVTIVDAGARKELRVVVESPEQGPGAQAPEAAAQPASRSAWPALHARIVELVRAHRTTIVFVNSRRLAERLASAVNDVAGEEIALAHHGSLAREKRAVIEERLKNGELPAIVATSSLELGIDVGAVDLVVQIESPPSVASGLQRIGRACHGVGGVPRGVLLPKHKQDLVACAAAAASLRASEVEETFYPRSPLDVLAQQVVAVVAMETVRVDDLFERVRQAAPFADLPRSAFEGVLDMLSGRYPSDEFQELRPRLTWDRRHGRLEARTGSHRLAVTNGGTIPDRGLYGVFTAGPAGGAARRVGELDEEMVFELQEGEVFLLGASSWRAEQITFDRVVVSPAAGEPGKMPFWHGDRAGRSRAFGLRIGDLVRRIAEGRCAAPELEERNAMTATAAAALVDYVRAQAAATGAVPSDRAVVLERFVDEMGDWRLVVLSPLGTRVLAPWAIAVSAALRAKYVDVEVHYTDDGMAFRVPACDEPPPVELFFPSPDEVEATVTRELDGTPVFAARFRECASRALLLPRRDPRRRTPLWAQRKRAAGLLAVASRHPTFPIVLEAYRECLRDAFDLPGLVELLRDVASRRVRVTTANTRAPSPFAASVLFAFVSNFIYDGDAPPAERRAQALSVDADRLRELLGETELRKLLDPAVIEEHERSLQRLSRPALHADGVHDVLLALGPLSLDELRARASPPESVERWLLQLTKAGRVLALRVAGRPRYVAVEDAARVRDGLGAALPDDLPPALLGPVEHAARDLVARFARTHGPFVLRDVAERFGLDGATVEAIAEELRGDRRLASGAFLPGGAETEWCDREVLDALRRRSLARLRRTIEPVDPRVFARFLPEWQGLSQRRRGRDALRAVIAELEGCPLLVSALEEQILPARLDDYRPWDLDALCAAGEVVWAGLEPLSTGDGRVALYFAEHEAVLARPVTPVEGPVAAAIRRALERRGAVFFADLARDVGGFPNDVLAVLWRMVWAGEIANDTFEPLRSLVRPKDPDAGRRGGAARRAVVARRGEPGTEGRWSLRGSRWGPPPDAAGRKTALARSLLDRYGLVTREAAHAEEVAGGFSAVYDVFKALEEQGRVRRGYFVEGRGGAQFAAPGADERLRALRDEPPGPRALVLAATDPASAWGSLVAWPSARGDQRPQRAAGASVVIDDGRLLGWLGRSGQPLLTFLPDGAGAEASARRLAEALGSLVDGERRRALVVSTIDGVEARESPLAGVFRAAGFVATLDGLVKRGGDPRREGGERPHAEGDGPEARSDA